MKEAKMTTISGTYTNKEYKKIEETIKKAFKDFWHNKITGEQLERIKKESGLKDAEIRGLQYEASLED